MIKAMTLFSIESGLSVNLKSHKLMTKNYFSYS